MKRKTRLAQGSVGKMPAFSLTLDASDVVNFALLWIYTSFLGVSFPSLPFHVSFLGSFCLVCVGGMVDNWMWSSINLHAGGCGGALLIGVCALAFIFSYLLCCYLGW
jgi:hypothetical protein